MRAGSGPVGAAGPSGAVATVQPAAGRLQQGFDQIGLRRVFAAFPTGVTALAALADGRPVGMTVNSFTSVSMQPPLASACVSRTSQTWHELGRAERLGISVLSATQEEAARRLAARGVDRFADVAWHGTEQGAVFLDEACAWFDCSVEERFGAGDHLILLLRVHAVDVDQSAGPLVFHGSRFHALAR